MAKGAKALKAGWDWIIDHAIERWPALLVLVVTGGGMSYLARATDWMYAYGPVAWGGIGLVSLLIVACVYFLYGTARARLSVASYTRHMGASGKTNVLAPVHEHERINLVDFYHPWFRPTENVRFDQCELMGPMNLYLQGCTLTHCGLNDCEIIVTRTDRQIKGAALFKSCLILRSQLYRVTLLMPFDLYNQLPDEIRQRTPVISDGRVGDL